MSKKRSAAEIDKEMHSSKGMEFLDRSKLRMHSFNVLVENAEELLDALNYLSQPEHGMRLMGQSNKDAGLQAHREINRHLHNFVAAAKSLVDHTRVLMKSYDRSAFHENYKSYIANNFEKDPLTKFVQDLRNYMLHRSLPASDMFIEIRKREDGSGHEAFSGVRLPTVELRNWAGWTAPAQTYIRAAGDNLDISKFVSEYLNSAKQFELWLNQQLVIHYRPDIDALESLRVEYIESVKNETAQHQPRKPSKQIKLEAPTFHNNKDINLAGKDIISSAAILEPAPMPAQFKSSRPVKAQIDGKAMLKEPVFTGRDRDGNPIMILSSKNNKINGLPTDGIMKIDSVIPLVCLNEWARTFFDQDDIRRLVIDWCQSKILGVEKAGLAKFMERSLGRDLIEREFLFPIDNLEVEREISAHVASVIPLLASAFERLDRQAETAPASQRRDVQQFVSDMKSKYLGLAAVKIKIKGGKSKSEKTARAVADWLVSVLQFLSPAGQNAQMVCIVGLSGASPVPTNSSFVFTSDGFSHSEGLAVKNAFSWRLTQAEFEDFKQLWAQAIICLASAPNSFGKDIQAAVKRFSEGAMTQLSANRLSATLDALERVFLRHEAEQGRLKIPGRVAACFINDSQGQKETASVIRQAYIYKRVGISQDSPLHTEFMNQFINIAHNAIATSLLNAANFTMRNDFLDKVEARKVF